MHCGWAVILITITKASPVAIALLTSSWLWMSVLLLALHNLSLINTCFLWDCENAICPACWALRPVTLSRSAVCTVQWTPVGLPCWWTPPWQPAQPPRLTYDLCCGLQMRREKKKGSCLNSAIRIWKRRGTCPLASRGNTHLWALWGDRDHQPIAGQVQSVMDCVIEHMTFDGRLNEEHNRLCDG